MISIRPVTIPFDAKSYAGTIGRQDGKNILLEIGFSNKFQAKLRSVEDPVTVVDLDGRIVAWLLPELLSSSMQVISGIRLYM